MAPNNPPKVVFEDDFLAVYDKPPGLVVTTSETQKESTLEDILRAAGSILDRGGIVHRLDKDTSGLILVAKQQEAFENLQSQFKQRIVSKEYLALVHGTVEKGGRIEASIVRNPGDREKFVVVPSGGSVEGRPACNAMCNIAGREAVTEYEVEEVRCMSEEVKLQIFEGFNKIQSRKMERSGYGQFSLLRCKPLTGRTHQIRVHLKYLGFPIVGDGKYGGRKTSRLDHRWCGRQFLHAAKIKFNHPKTGERLSFESKLPEDLQQALNKLEKVK